MDDDDWEELDENAMEECMILATQLCTKQPQQQQQNNNNNSTHISKVPQSKSYPETGNKNLPGVFTNGSLNNNVRDSGVCSTRSTSLHQSASNINSTVNQRKDVPNNNNYMNRFSDFSAKTSSSYQSSSSKKQSFSVGKNAGYSKGKSPVKQWPGSDVGAGSHTLLLKKAEEDKAKLDERILVMQGEISILRSELKRKETALETERIDHCAAIENAEKRGREKVAKQTAEADTKLKEKGVTLEKLQGELHFKKREVEELLNRCLRLEQQPQASHSSEPANKRPRHDKNSLLYGKDGDSSIASRFDFSRRPSKVCVGVGVQTEALQPKDPHRMRLEVTSSKGQVSQTRRIATLLSCSASAHTQDRPSSSAAPAPASSSSAEAASTSIPASTESNENGSDGWSLPAEWLSIISMGLRETEESVDEKLVGVAVERLHQTHSTMSQKDGDQCRLTQLPNNPTQWYETQVGPAIQVLSYFNSSSELSVLQAITAHLPPLLVKDVMVNKRLRLKVLEATERISRLLKHPIERNHSEGLVSTLRDYCISIENGTEAGLILKVAAALSYHCRLCVSSDVCLITHLCKKVKKLCVPEVGVLRALLDLTWSLVKITLPSLWLNSTTTTTSTTSTSCSCSSQLLGTFIWHIYQTLEASHLKSNKRKVYGVLSSCIQVLHHWSTVDTHWWEKVSPFPHYPSLMATLAAKAKDIKFDKDTVELLCDLYEFEEGAFES